MKILQIISHYIPADRFGGPQRVAHGLGRALSRAGHDVSVCATNLLDEAKNLCAPIDRPVTIEGVTVFYEPTIISRYWGFSPKMARRIAVELKHCDVTLVHAHYQFANLIGAWLARHYAKPYVVFAHGSLNTIGIDHRNSFLKRAYLRILEKRNFEEALFIVFNSVEEKANSLFQEMGLVLPNGIESADFADLPEPGHFRTLYPEIGNKVCYLYLGRLDYEGKGLDLLLPAFQRLVARNKNAHLVIAGPDHKGGMEKVRAFVTENGLNDRITTTGLITGALKAAALRDADVFVLPSRFEGLSIALLEALYMELPTLITNQIGLCETVNRIGAGIVVPPDIDSLHEGLYKLLDPICRNTLGCKGASLVRDEYSWDAISAALLANIMESMIARGYKVN